MLTTNRKFKIIKLNKLLFIGQNKTIEIFQRHGVNVVKLYLIESCVDSCTKFAELLKCMPDLRHEIFESSCMLRGVKKLKTLEMVASEYTIIKCFQRGKLATLKILNSPHRYSLVCGPLEDFLKSQES